MIDELAIKGRPHLISLLTLLLSLGVFLGLYKTDRHRICHRGDGLSETENAKHRMKPTTSSSSSKSVTHT